MSGRGMTLGEIVAAEGGMPDAAQNGACTSESNSGLPSPPDSSPSGSFETTSKATTDHALAKQEGGSHYKALAIQPVEYIHANAIGFFEGNVIKYVTRWRAKAGVEDLRKAKHYIELLIELESKGDVPRS